MRQIPGSLVNRYAKALFAAAEKAERLSEVQTDVQAISAAWRENPEFVLLALNPRLSKAKVRALLMSLADRTQAQPLTRQFLNLLVDKDRLEILGTLSDFYDKLWRDHQGEVEVTVTTAVPVSDTVRSAILNHLSERSGRKPLVNWREDRTILGGIVIHWPDRVFDGSLVRKLDNLKAGLAQTV